MRVKTKERSEKKMRVKKSEKRSRKEENSSIINDPL